MAEAIGIASGLVALTTFAFQAACGLHATIESIKSHPRRIQNILDELHSLSDVLASLTDLVKTNADVAFPALEQPLYRCGSACTMFQQEVMKNSSHSQDGRRSMRDWAKLKYAGSSIEDFSQSLAACKLTIAVALAGANLRTKVFDTQQLEAYKSLNADATKALETRLENIEERLDVLIETAATVTGPGSDDLNILKEEQLSTHRCLDICAELSAYINKLELETRASGTASDALPERLMHEGFQDIKLNLQNTTSKIEQHLQIVLDRLVAKSRAVLKSEEEVAELTTLRDEWKSARQSVAMCAKMNEQLLENIGYIENYGTGDSVQFMLSTTGKPLRGINRGMGWRNRQLGGYMDAGTARQLSTDMLSNRSVSHDQTSMDEAGRTTQYDVRYGAGSVLGSERETTSQETKMNASTKT